MKSEVKLHKKRTKQGNKILKMSQRRLKPREREKERTPGGRGSDISFSSFLVSAKRFCSNKQT